MRSLTATPACPRWTKARPNAAAHMCCPDNLTLPVGRARACDVGSDSRWDPVSFWSLIARSPEENTCRLTGDFVPLDDLLRETFLGVRGQTAPPAVEPPWCLLKGRRTDRPSRAGFEGHPGR